MKNLKMFAISLVAFAAMTMGVHALEAPSQCKDSALYVDLGNSSYSCATSIGDAITAAKTNKGGEIVLLKDLTMGSDRTIEVGNVTINLNEHKLTIAASKTLTISGANVTIKNGTIDAASSVVNAITVNSADKASTLTIEKDVTVDGANLTGAFITVSNAQKETIINLSGKWNLKNEMVDCSNGEREKLTINLDATVTATEMSGALVSLDAGTTIVNVKGGSYTSDHKVFEVKNGTLNISAGTIASTAHNAIVVEKADAGFSNTLNITGGNISTTAQGKYSLLLKNGAKTNTYSISGGEFTSGKDADNNQLAAINITDKDFLTNHANMISGGKFTYAIVGDILVGEDVYQTAEAAVKALTGNATVTNENGVVTVGAPATTEPEQQDPTVGDGTQTPEPENVPNVPKTSDNILVYASLGLISAVSVGFTAKRKENN